LYNKKIMINRLNAWTTVSRATTTCAATGIEMKSGLTADILVVGVGVAIAFLKDLWGEKGRRLK